ncbi:hypothetical protein BHF71_08290 [Vulcanibacillus modesticaldus]|uniref:Uncharacterized protein n=1 Tax=Vulcanibacillus modesticaldus TaxID=337097 RepID=A0A1D2YV71_9BACI|nr:YqhG family protein [Vulcanibacillus modesticaldus]OEF99612.1 hypothetical protein BHF71_08290 [Vulcanibacillus modesticaldus]
MNQIWVRDYLKRYFMIHQCHFIEEGPGHLEVKLSVEVDKDLTNRPYYWTFVERTGAEPETLTMTFIFDQKKVPEGIRGEEIRFGSERLKQIFNSAKKRGKMVRLYQQPKQKIRGVQIPTNYYTLSPWLGVNYKVEFISDQKKDLLISLGIDLGTGKMKQNFYQYLKQLDLSPVLPANVSTLAPFISIREAALQLEEWIIHEIHKQNFNWAIEANERLKEELKMVELFYEIESENKTNIELLVEKEKRIEEVKWQYSPKIEVSPINFGIFYLDKISI